MNGTYKSLTFLLGIVAGLLFVAGTSDASSGSARVGDVYEILRSYENNSEKNGEFSGSSNGKSTIIERVIRVEQDGFELQYEEPLVADGKRQARNWQLPARVYRPLNGAPTLLNAAELEARVDPWLKQGKMTRTACEQWIFTWNAFKIECDPASALGIIEQFNLWSFNLSTGHQYEDGDALTAVPLRLKSSNAQGSIYMAELQIDPEKVKRAQAESDVVVRKIMGETKSLEDALAQQDTQKISGTISVEIETNPSGQIRKRTNVTKLRVEEAGGEVETRTSKVIVERKPAASDQN